MVTRKEDRSVGVERVEEGSSGGQGELAAEAQALLRSLLDRANDASLSKLATAEENQILAVDRAAGSSFVVLSVPDRLRDIMSQREKDVLYRLGHGRGNKGIACELGLSKPTIASHIRKIAEKLGARSRAEIMRYTAVLTILECRRPSSVDDHPKAD